MMHKMPTAIYQEMWKNAFGKIANNQYEIDLNINNNNDTKRGISIVAYLERNNLQVTKNISDFLMELKVLEPDQYYYPSNELHMTLTSIVSCTEGFQLSDEMAEKYRAIFSDVMQTTPLLEIQFTGVTLSPSCIVIQGFPSDQAINILRDKLRNAFNASSLFTNFDVRYKLVAAHISAMRFAKPLNDPHALLAFCQRNRDKNFGSMKVTNYSLVFNNWYQNTDKTQILAEHVLD